MNNANIVLNSTDFHILIDSLSEIHEAKEISFVDSTELHYALANIVGDLRNQLGLIPHTPDLRLRKRIDLGKR